MGSTVPPPELAFEAVNLESIADPGLRRCFAELLNLVQTQATEIRALRAENQRLRDEIARLKGEQGRPHFPGRSKSDKSPGSTNHSSEKERKKPGKWRKEGKVVHVDREEKCAIDRSALPADAEFKGYTPFVVQDVLFRTDNVLFSREKFYSPSEGKAYLAPLPAGYDGGEFGPGLISYVLTQYFIANTSGPKILEILRDRGIVMSEGQLSNILTRKHEKFHQEKAEVFAAGIESAPWQQLDDTITRIDGVAHHCHVLGNVLYSTFTTLPGKDRISILDVLRGGAERAFLYNDMARVLAETFGVSSGILEQLEPLSLCLGLGESKFRQAIRRHAPRINKRQLEWVLQASAIAEYHNQDAIPVIRSVLTDDARQFRGLVEEHALCWIHEGRHYKKLTPVLRVFQEAKEEFLDTFWEFYRQLLAYREAPSTYKAKRLERKFDKLFSSVTPYDELNERIALTKAKKSELLLVLKHPELPLHNNDSELSARQRVRKRDVSFGPRSSAGARCWDTFQSLVATAKKLGINAYEYIEDRVRGTARVPRLAAVITERAAALGLGASWESRTLPRPSS